eukprot:gene14267-16841_t
MNMDGVRYSSLDNRGPADEVENNLLLPSNINKRGYGEQSAFKRYVKHNWKFLIVLTIVIIVVIAAIVIPVVILHVKKSDVLSDRCEEDSKSVVEAALKGTSAYDKLYLLCTQFGNRLSGSQSLENAIDWVAEQMTADGLDNVRKEAVNVTHWVRGNEHCSIQVPYFKRMNILGLGGSIATPVTGINATVMVVGNFTDLDARSAEAAGKIVLFNYPFTNYSDTVQYRVGGASAAAKYGAVAALVRSVTPYSLGTPHTGGMHYSGDVKIPTAAVTLEDADLIQGLYNLNISVSINLYMEAQTMPNPAVSHNVMGELTGTDFPDQVVVIGGHIDSWDVGQGAMDDGGGVAVAWEAVRMMKNMGIKPKRTIRVVAWTNEENGAAGGAGYALLHKNETFFSIETDGGATTPQGFSVAGTTPASLKALQKLADMSLTTLGANKIIVGESGEDNSFLIEEGVKPAANLLTDMSQYFWFHHSEGDALDKMNPTQMNQCVATMAAMSLCVANFNGDFPQ